MNFPRKVSMPPGLYCGISDFSPMHNIQCTLRQISSGSQKSDNLKKQINKKKLNKHACGVVYCDNYFKWVVPAAPCNTTFPNEPLCRLSLWLGSEMHTAPVRSCIGHPICSWQTVVHTSKMSLALTIAGRLKRDNLSFAEVIKWVAACKTCEINVERLTSVYIFSFSATVEQMKKKYWITCWMCICIILTHTV